MVKHLSIDVHREHLERVIFTKMLVGRWVIYFRLVVFRVYYKYLWYVEYTYELAGGNFSNSFEDKILICVPSPEKHIFFRLTVYRFKNTFFPWSNVSRQQNLVQFGWFAWFFFEFWDVRIRYHRCCSVSRALSLCFSQVSPLYHPLRFIYWYFSVWWLMRTRAAI